MEGFLGKTWREEREERVWCNSTSVKNIYFFKKNLFHEEEGEKGGEANHRVSLLPREAGSALCPAPPGSDFRTLLWLRGAARCCDRGWVWVTSCYSPPAGRAACGSVRVGQERLPLRPGGAGKKNLDGHLGRVPDRASGASPRAGSGCLVSLRAFGDGILGSCT